MLGYWVFKRIVGHVDTNPCIHGRKNQWSPLRSSLLTINIWVKWLDHPCHLGDPQCGDKIKSGCIPCHLGGPHVGKVVT